MRRRVLEPSLLIRYAKHTLLTQSACVAHRICIKLNFTTPLAASPLLDFSLSAFALNRDHSAFASHLEQSQGGRAKLSVSDHESLHGVLEQADNVNGRQGHPGELMTSPMKWCTERSQILPKTRPCRMCLQALPFVRRADCHPSSIRELAEPSSKASVTHTFTRDTRDDPWMGTAGSLLKISHVDTLRGHEDTLR